MTDNSTQQTETTTSEQITEAEKQKLWRIKRDIEKLQIDFTPVHTELYFNLWRKLSKPSTTPPTTPPGVDCPYYQRADTITLVQRILSQSREYIRTFSAFKKEYAQILTSGEQATLFDEETPHMTVAQKRVWKNYAELTPDERKCELLLFADILVSTAELIDELLENGKSFLQTTKARKYYAALQAKPLCDAAEMQERHKRWKEDEFDKTKVAVYKLERGDTELTIRSSEFNLDERLSTLAPSTKYLLFFTLVQFAYQNEYWHKTDKNKAQLELFNLNSVIQIPLIQYAKLRGRSTQPDSLKAFKRETAIDIARLRSITLKGNWGTRKQRVIKIYGICSGGEISNDTITIRIDEDFARQLITSSVTYLPHEIFSLDARRPGLFPLAFALCLHYSMYNNYKRETYNIIAVKNLLRVRGGKRCNEFKGDRHYDRRIYKPFEADMDALIEGNILSSWEYCNNGGEPLTDAQLDGLSHKTILELFIKYELKDYPTEEHKKRMEEYHKRKRIQSKKEEKTTTSI